MAHVATWKKEEVANLKELMDSYDVIAMVDLAEIPARQLQKMRKSLKDKAILKMSKKTLISLALNDCNNKKQNIIELADYMDGQPALIFTEMNPFKLYKILEDSKTPAPAKAGSTAEGEILIPEGDTGFPPGPFLGELQQVGIPAKIDKGKIVVSEDYVAVEPGEKVSAKLAAVLARLDINPMEVGINLNAAYEDETLYTSDILAIDEEETFANISNAYRRAFNLSVNAVIYTKETISTIIGNAANKSVNLAVEASIINSKTSEILLAQAQAQMLALASEVSSKNQDAVDNELLEKINSSSVSEEIPEETEEEAEEEEEEEEEEIDAAAGLGALFG